MTHTSSHPIINQRYQVKKTLGQGAMGITYQALDLQQNTLVALKEISLKNLTSAKQLELLEREVKVLQQLHHPQIPAYLDYFEIETENNKTFYIVQELAQGKTLHQWVKEGWRVSEAEVKNIAVQILQILDYLHSFNPPIIHRDIKPHNLIRSEEGKIYLVDFGAVQNAYYTTFLGGSTTIGTFGYMPLEQANGSAVPASDLYSLGATLLYLITRRSPEEFCQGLRFKIPNNLNLSEDFKNWLETLLEPDIEDRFSSAKEALKVLQNPPLKINNKKVFLVVAGLATVTLSSLFLFNQYKWAILNRLGFPAPVEVCDSDSRYGDDLTRQFWKSGGRFSPLDFKKCSLWSLKNNHIPMTTWLLNHNTDVAFDVKNEDGRTLLHIAASGGNYEIAQLLIDNEADIDAKGHYGNTPLFHAASAGHLEITELLIKNGADIDAKGRYGNTSLSNAASAGHLEITELLIKNGADIDAKGRYRHTPLSNAASAGHLEIAELLIKNGADIDAKGRYGKTPLFHAASAGHLEIAELLIQKGADINVKGPHSTPLLHDVVLTGHLEIVELLIQKGADINAQDNDGRTPLHDVLKENENFEIVELLVNNGADINVKDNDGQTPLAFVLEQWSNSQGLSSHKSRKPKNPKIAGLAIKQLIKNGANVNIKNKYGDTPLHHAIRIKVPEIVELLLENGANVDVKNKYGDTPLYWAMKKARSSEIITVLLKNGADINAQDESGNTPLHWVINVGAFETKEFEIFKVLIENGADVNAQDKSGRTPLHNVANVSSFRAKRFLKSFAKCVKILIENGAEVNAKDNDGSTPLDYARYPYIREILKQYGAQHSEKYLKNHQH